jgi:hypothetical protein
MFILVFIQYLYIISLGCFYASIMDSLHSNLERMQMKKLLNQENKNERELYAELNRIKSHYKKIWNLVNEISIEWTWFISLLLFTQFTGFLHPIDQSIDLLKHSNIGHFFKYFPGSYWRSFSSFILFTILS